MTHDDAKAIAAEVAPHLIVDEQSKMYPAAFVVRKTEKGAPFSITLPVMDHGMEDDEVIASERKMLTDALVSAERMLG